jgi:hypothetical protein
MAAQAGLTYSVPGVSCAHCRVAIAEAGYEVAP